MALFNYAAKEITLKIVYYGPGLCGKTTNLQKLHSAMSPEKKSKLLSLSTESDRTLFFDFMPISLGKIKEFNIKFQLYTVPGQVRYNATRKLVLKGADAVIFVADSQTAMKEQNIESLKNMLDNLTANNLKIEEIPTILQYNKRDLKNILSIEEMNIDLNPKNDMIVEASALKGIGVEETFKIVTSRLLKHIAKKHNVRIDSIDEEETKPTVMSPVMPQPRPILQTVEAKQPLDEMPRAPQSKPLWDWPPKEAEPKVPQTQTQTQIVPQPSTPPISTISGLSGIGQQLAIQPVQAGADSGELLKSLLIEIKESKKYQADILTTLKNIEKVLSKSETQLYP